MHVSTLLVSLLLFCLMCNGPNRGLDGFKHYGVGVLECDPLGGVPS